MSYRVNGWNQQMDYRTGEVYYTCPDCGCTEGGEHDEECPLYYDATEELVDVDFEEEDDFAMGVDNELHF